VALDEKLKRFSVFLKRKPNKSKNKKNLLNVKKNRNTKN